MDLAVNIPLFAALDRCWEILAECFGPQEVGMRKSILEAHWPKKPAHAQAQAAAEK